MANDPKYLHFRIVLNEPILVQNELKIGTKKIIPLLISLQRHGHWSRRANPQMDRDLVDRSKTMSGFKWTEVKVDGCYEWCTTGSSFSTIAFYHF